MRTQKQKLEYLKENKFSIYTFVNGARESSITHCDAIRAFYEMAKWNAKGRRTVLIAETSIGALDRVNHEVIKYEEENKERAPYTFILRYECVYNETLERWEPSFK